MNISRSIFLALLLALAGNLQALDIQVQGLFRDTAVLQIDGRQQVLKAGERSPEGVLLVSADRRQAVIEFGGKRHTLALSRRITTHYSEAVQPEVSIPRNSINQYITTASINSRRMQVLVDTGANAVAMNSADARRLGIDYRQGAPTQVKTAGGISPAYIVKLRSVKVGGIEVAHVDGFVVDGGFPEMVLLGMSFLQHVDMREESGILYLKGKY